MLKLNLGCGQDLRQDHMNIDIGNINPTPENFKQGDISNLDWCAEDNSVDEVLALNILPYIPLPLIDDTISNWLKKLKVGGTIKILTADLMSISEDFVNNQIPIQEYLILLFGTQENPGAFRKSSIDKNILISKLKSMGMQVCVIRYENNGRELYIEAVKERCV